MTLFNRSSRYRQQGTVLVLSLIILSVLTLVAVTGMKTSVTEEKMTGNLRDRELAYQSSEAALRQARTDIDGLSTFALLDNTDGLLDEQSVEMDYYDRSNWYTAGNYTTISGGMASGQMAGEPRYVIKLVSSDQDWCKSASQGSLGELQGNAETCISYVFLISAHGTGLSPDTTMVLQEYYGRPEF